MHEKELDGYRLTVEPAGRDKKRGRGPQNEDECWQCGKKGHWYFYHIIYIIGKMNARITEEHQDTKDILPVPQEVEIERRRRVD